MELEKLPGTGVTLDQSKLEKYSKEYAAAFTNVVAEALTSGGFTPLDAIKRASAFAKDVLATK